MLQFLIYMQLLHLFLSKTKAVLAVIRYDYLSINLNIYIKNIHFPEQTLVHQTIKSAIEF